MCISSFVGSLFYLIHKIKKQSVNFYPTILFLGVNYISFLTFISTLLFFGHYLWAAFISYWWTSSTKSLESN